MKKSVAALLLPVFALSLFGCNAQPKRPSLYVEPAQLTAQEKNIVTLLGKNSGQALYDIVLDETVQSVSINTYQLIDSAWEPISEGWQEFSDPKGRLALSFDNLADGLRVALQSDRNSGATTYTTNTEEDFSGMSCATSYLSDVTEIVYDKAIPLVIQISTTKHQTNLYNMESFFLPEQYAQQGYEHVYAITLRFSQKTVGELEQP